MRTSSFVRGQAAATAVVPWRVAAATIGLAAVALLVAACGPNSEPSSSASASASSASASASSASASASVTASPSLSPADPAVCADATALRATLAKIPHALAENSASALTADLDAAKTELDHLADASGDQYRAQSGGLESALTSLQTAISADAHGTGSILGVFTAAGHVTTQAQLLLSAAGNCPSPSPSSAS
jgi:trimeric autotransporter adhesin